MSATRLEEEIHIEKPVAEVFAAWQTADALAAWFAPQAVRVPEVELDFRVGGHYSIRMVLPGDLVFTTVGTYKAIVANEKIVMTWRCDAFPDPETLVTISFIADDAGTLVRVKHERFTSADTCANHKQGWGLCLAGLKDTLQKLHRTPGGTET